MLIDWYSRAKRDLPWRKTKNPYLIWLSEIILQQTRVDQGLPYFLSFEEHFPTVHDLANASENLVLKTWEGLGYYSRARNLHHTAKHISGNLKGQFPTDYLGLIKLKGIGPYTAAAIASICFDEPKAVIDGNVFRFTARYFGLDHDISEAKSRTHFENILQELITDTDPGIFNQAMMEHGATVCKPVPDCGQCVFRQGCYARKHNQQSTLPVKSKKVKVKEEHLAYCLIRNEQNQVLVQKRTNGIWIGLYEFFPIHTSVQIKQDQVFNHFTFIDSIVKIENFEPVKHLLTHKKLLISFYHIDLGDEILFKQFAEETGMQICSWQEMLTLPFPKVIVNHLRQIAF